MNELSQVVLIPQNCGKFLQLFSLSSTRSICILDVSLLMIAPFPAVPHSCHLVQVQHYASILLLLHEFYDGTTEFQHVPIVFYMK